jgi:hypothetical protein
METAALLLAILVLGALISEATLRAHERYVEHLKTLRRLDDEQ